VTRVFWFVFLMAGWAVALPTEAEQGSVGEAEAEVEQASGDVPAEESRFEEIPEAHWKTYFEKKPDGFLIDPQRLLSPVARRDRAAFLEYHAGDSSIDLHVYLVASDQKIPETALCEGLVKKFFSEGKPAAVVFYPFGAPERAVLHLSPALADIVPEAENKRALASSVMQAVEKSDPAGQLESFLVQMSIRLYWMERIMGQGEAEEGEAAAVVKPPAVVEPEESLLDKLEPVFEIAREWVAEAAAVMGALIVLLAAMVWARFRARHVLPDFCVEPRLGGEHGAGVGAVISFANASVPPASQRDRLG
jgi:hypothetical protein